MAARSYWTPAFVKLLAFELLCQFGANVVNPIVSNYAVALGATLSLAGLLAGLNSLCAMLLRPIGSLILDEISKKHLLIVAAIVFALSSFLCSSLSSTVALGVSRVIFGAAFVVKSSLVLALASLSVSREYVGRAVGLIGLSTIVASAIGPSIGFWFGMTFGYRASFLVSAVLFVVAMLVSFSFEEPSAVTPEGVMGVVSGKADSGKIIERFFHVKTFPIAGVVALLGLIFGAVTTLILLVCEQRGIGGGSLFFFVYAAVTFAVRPFSSKIFDTKGLGALYYPTTISTCLSVVVLAFASNTAMVLVSAVFLALGQGCLYPLLQAESVCRVSAVESPLAANTFLLGADAGMSFGPIVSGSVFQIFGSTVMLMFLLLVGLILIGVYPLYSRYAEKVLCS